MWDKVFKNGPREICGRQSLKNLKLYGDMVLLSIPYQFKVFEGCLPQILLDPFLNTLSHIIVESQRVRSSRLELFCKKIILKISQNLPENNCARASFFSKVAGWGLQFY